MKPLIFEKPGGVRDYLPRMAERKRQVEQILTKTYAEWGYEEVITPTFEYLDTFQSSIRSTDDRLFKFFDRTGRTVVLRPDMTAPIARVVSSLLREQPLPIRLCYTASIFRQQERAAGRDSEFTQAGVELVGDPSPDADAEMIALAVHALRSAGVDGFQFALGQVRFISELFAEYVSDAAMQEQLSSALAEKDHVGYERVIAEGRRIGLLDDRAAHVLGVLPSLRGGLEVLSRARALTERRDAQHALDNMEAIWRVLALYGVNECVQIDLGLLLGQNYYTGAVFEGYAPGVGFPVCGGGRYDELMGNFGRQTAATGFMIGIERILEGLSIQRENATQNRVLLLYGTDNRGDALAFAAYLRERGYRVAAQRDQGTNDAAFGYCVLRLQSTGLTMIGETMEPSDEQQERSSIHPCELWTAFEQQRDEIVMQGKGQ